MAVACSPVICSVSGWNKLLTKFGLTDRILSHDEYSQFESMVSASTDVRSSIETVGNHLLSAPIQIKLGEDEISPEDEAALLGDWQTGVLSFALKSGNLYSYKYGHSFYIPGKEGPVAVDPLTCEVHAAYIYIIGKWVFHVVPRLVGSVTGTAPKNSAEMSAQVASSLKQSKLQHQKAVSAGSKRKRERPSSSSSSSASASAATTPGEDDGGDDEEDIDEKEYGIHISPAMKAAMERGEFESMLLVQEFCLSHDGRIKPILETLIKPEADRNRFLADAIDATGAAARPTLFTVALTQTPAERENGMSYNVAGDADAMARSTTESTATAAIAANNFYQSRLAFDNYVKKVDQKAALLAQEFERDSVGRPISKPGLASAFTGRREPIESGRTGFIGPQAEAPNFLMTYQAWMANEAGRSTGVPAVMTGDLMHAVAVNQNVMYVFGATLQTRRSVFSMIITEMFRMWKSDVLKDLFKKKLDKSGKLTKGVLAETSRKFAVTAGFPSLMDPVLTERCYALKAIDEKTFIRCTSAYTGLSVASFDEARMKAAFRRTVALEEAQVAQAKSSAEQADVAVEQAELNVEAASVAIKEGTVGTSASGSGSSGSAKAGPKKKQKPNPTHSDLKQSVDRSQAVHGAGKGIKQGAASSKVRHPEPSKPNKV